MLKKLLKIIGFLLIVASIGYLLFVLFTTKNYVVTQGTFIDYHTEETPASPPFNRWYYPIIQFKTNEGLELSFIDKGRFDGMEKYKLRHGERAGRDMSNFETGFSLPYKTGDKVTVIYNPANPNEAMIKSPRSQFGVSLILVISGLMLLVFAYIFMAV